MDDDLLLKVLVVGDVAVGKTSIIQRYTNDSFRKDYKTTIGVEFALKPIEVDDKCVNIQLWDIAGQDRFIGLLRNFYRNASAAIVVYDITSPKTLQNAVKWKADIDKKVRLPDGGIIPCILLGNKSDLRETEGTTFIDPEYAMELAKKSGFIGCMETSAKTGANVGRACKGLVKKVITSMKNSQPAQTVVKDSNITLKGRSQKKADSSCCN